MNEKAYKTMSVIGAGNLAIVHICQMSLESQWQSSLI